MSFRRILALFIALLIACAPSVAQSKGDSTRGYRDPAKNSVMTEIQTFSGDEVDALITQLGAWDKSKDVSEIWIRINSNGGSVENGYKLIHWIEQADKKIVCVADTKAYSMGFFLLESCDERLMTRRASLMAHEASVSGVDGNAHELRDVAEHLRALSEGLMQNAAVRMNISEDALRAKMTNKSWWINYQEALKTGAIDGLADPRNVPPLTLPSIPKASSGLLQLLLGP